MKKNYKEFLPHIRCFVFDVDGVLTEGHVLVTSTGELLRSMNIKDGYAIKTAITKGYKVCIISGGTNEGVARRLENLGIGHIFLGAHNKKEILNSYLQKNDIDIESTLYMGDDLPDIEPMQLVGLPCCPDDAVAEVKQISRYVSHKPGGRGCVRDVIEQVLKVQENWN